MKKGHAFLWLVQKVLVFREYMVGGLSVYYHLIIILV